MAGQVRRARMRGMEKVMIMVRQQLEPLRNAIIFILKTLKIEYELPPISTIKPTIKKKTKKRINEQINAHIQTSTNTNNLDDITGIDGIDFEEHLLQCEPSQGILARKEEVVVPRGNNFRFKAEQLPEQAPRVKEGHDEWQRLWKQARRLVQGKRVKGERGWFDFEKKMLVELVSKGRALGVDVSHLTNLLGLSPTTLKRWRLNLPYCNE